MTSRFCRACGAPLGEGATECPACAAPVTALAAPRALAPVTAPRRRRGCAGRAGRSGVRGSAPVPARSGCCSPASSRCSASSGARARVLRRRVGGVGAVRRAGVVHGARSVHELVGHVVTRVTTTSAAVSSAGTVERVSGSTAGLYGGTLDESSCDREKQITFLAANPAKATAFAGVLSIGSGDIATYIRGLTPVVLLLDTRVDEPRVRRRQRDIASVGVAGRDGRARRSVRRASCAVPGAATR